MHSVSVMSLAHLSYSVTCNIIYIKLHGAATAHMLSCASKASKIALETPWLASLEREIVVWAMRRSANSCEMFLCWAPPNDLTDLPVFLSRRTLPQRGPEDFHPRCEVEQSTVPQSAVAPGQFLE